MISDQTLKQLQVTLLLECERIAFEEAYKVIHAVHPRVTRTQLQARFDAKDVSDRVYRWLIDRARAHYAIGGGDGPYPSDLDELLIFGEILDRESGEWRDVGVPKF